MTELRRLRVLHVIPAVAARYGGPSEAAVQLVRALGARGLDVTLATTNADGPQELPVPVGRVVSHEGVPAIFFHRRRPESFKYAPDLSRWLQSSLASFDVVHIHAVFSHTSIVSARHAWQRRVPYVLRPLGTLTPYALARKALRKRVLRRLVGQPMIARAGAVHYTTEAERALTESIMGPTAGVVVPLGIADVWLQARPVAGSDRETVFLIVGRLHPVKNVESAIAAFHQATAGVSAGRWRLVIAGDGEADYERRLREAAADGPERERISFVGWLDEARKRQWLDRVAVLVQPSYQESFGISVLEALASGTPVIVSTGVALSGIIGAAGAGWVCEPDASSLGKAMRAAMGDPGFRHRAGALARGLASQYTWDAAARTLEDVYARLREGAPSDGRAPRPVADALALPGR